MYSQFQSSEPKTMSKIKPYHNPKTLPIHRKRYHPHQPFSKEHVLKMQQRLLELKRERDLVYRRIRKKHIELKQLQDDSDNINGYMWKLERDLSLSRRSSVSSNSSMDSMKTQYADGFESDRGLSDFDDLSDDEYVDTLNDDDDTVNPLDHMILYTTSM